MDILIKSFNRPYYLDRCLCSIQKFGIRFRGQIFILDDGTPHKYLDKIKEKYPFVTILKSNFYEEKTKLIEISKTDEINKIPIELWLSAASKASDYFLLLEDDFWFTADFDFDFYEKTASAKNMALLKLFWLGNEKLIHGKTIYSDAKFLMYKPDIYTWNPILFKIVFNLNRFGFNKIMRFLKLYSKDRFLKYYAIYSVAGTIFKKDYFLSLWKNHKNLVDEKLQIKNALKYLTTNIRTQFGSTITECLKTGFSASATNKLENPIAIDIFEFNKLLNEAWFSGDFVTTENLQDDLDELYILKIIEQSEGKINFSKTQWKEWVLHFKNQFRAVGCIID